MSYFDSSSKSFRYIILPVCLAYFFICIFLGGWPLNLFLTDVFFDGRIAFLLMALCILHSRNVFQNITRESLLEALGFLFILGIATYLRFKRIPDLILSGPTMDEPLLVRPVLRMLRTGSYDFGNYEYGGAYFYLLEAVCILMILRGISRFWYRNMNEIPDLEYYNAGRMASAAFSVVTVACVYGIARKYFGRLAAITASLILTFSTISFITAHQVRLDVPLALWVLLAHWFFLRILDEPSGLNYVFAGILCGLAVGTKFTVLPIFISLVVTHALVKKEKWVNWNLVLGLFCGGTTYLLTNLYAFINLNTLLTRLPNAIYHMNPKHWSSVPNRALEYTFELMGQGVGVVALLAALITLPRIFLRPGPAEVGSEGRASNHLLILWTFPLLHMMLIGSYPAGFPRYLLPIIPLLAILAGEGVRMIVEWLTAKVSVAPRWSKFVLPAALTVLIVQPAWTAYSHYAELAKTLSPKEVITWIDQNIPAGSKILSDPTGPVISPNRYKVTFLNYAQFMEPRRVKGFDYVRVSEDLFKRIPASYELLHEFPARTKALDRSIRIYKSRQ